MPDVTSDINPRHLLVRYLPVGWWPYAALSRLDRPTGTYLAFLPAFMGLNLATFYLPASQKSFQEWLMLGLVLFIGAWAMRSAGCIWNDWLDRDLDKKVARTKNRPVASGRISSASALSVLLCLLLLSASLLLLLPVHALWVLLLIIPGSALYPMMKRWVDAPQLWLGLTFNAGVWVPWLALHGPHNLMMPTVLYCGCICWTLGYDTVYALQDIQDDEKTGIRSLAFGKGQSRWNNFVLFLLLLFLVYPSIPQESKY